MDAAIILQESAIQSVKMIAKLVLIILPVMVVFEILYTTKTLNKLSKYFLPITNFFETSKKSAFPLMVGLFVGLTYGAGILYRYAQKKLISRRDFNIVSALLSLCHAVIEDTLIFAVVGASLFWIFGVRIVITAILIKGLLLIGKSNKRLDLFGG